MGPDSLNEALPSKPALRATVLSRRDHMTPEARAAASAAIARRVRPILARLRPQRVAGYLAMRSECDPAPILDAARAAGAEIVLPVTVPGHSLIFRRYDPGDPLLPGGFGTRVPLPAAPAVEPDFIVVPVVGFDRRGVRLGYGKGHYDRTITAIRARGGRPPLLGIAFACQEVDRVPHEAHDVHLDWIATETELLDFRTGDH